MNLKYLVEGESSLISFFCEKYNLFSDDSRKGMFEEVDLVLKKEARSYSLNLYCSLKKF